MIWFEVSRRIWNGRESRLARDQCSVSTIVGEKPWVTMEIRQLLCQCECFLGFTGAIIKEIGNISWQKITGFVHKVRLLWENYHKWKRRENSISHFISLLLVNTYLLRFSICQKLVEILHWTRQTSSLQSFKKSQWTKLMRFSKKPFKF